MQKLFISLLSLTFLFFFTGCYENTQEITLNADGTGLITNTNDMSGLMGMIKQMAGEEEMAKAGDTKLDTTYQLGQDKEVLEELTDEDKKLAATGTLRINLNMKDEVLKTILSFPFTKPAEIGAFNKLSTKILAGATKNMVGEGMPEGGAEEMPEPSSLDDYYTMDFNNGLLIKKLDAEKYAEVDKDKFLTEMKGAGDMGVEMKNIYIIHLPRPAIKAEGSRVELSEDKLTVTIKAGINDFFSDPKLLEFHIEY